MATRGARRSYHVPESIELPSIETPQYVDEEGYEVDAETFALALRQTEGEDEAGQDLHIAVEGQADDEEGTVYADDIEVDGEGQTEEAVVDEVEELEPREPLLSLSDSNVLNYSLMATRQHHLRHLLPHMFSHPPIPTAMRQRARPPPKGTFLWPTPPPLVHPLPQREYHGASQASATGNPQGSPTPTTPSANPAEQSNPAEGSEPKKRKNARSRNKDKSDGVEAPAHEIECLARVTLSIGPISYPGTELWVGRFVQPRAAGAKQPRARKDKTERKRPSVVDGGPAVPKRPRPQGGPPGYVPGQQDATIPSGTRPPHAPGMAYSAPRPPPPPRAELSPDLIRRVNEAATKHPWLSQIIHRAARTQATKEELAKLGRVVNRLKEGKDVGEGPDDPAPPTGPSLPSTQPVQGSSTAGPRPAPGPSSAQARPPPAAAPRPPESLGVPQSSSALSSAASNTSEPLTPPPQEEESDSDSDEDMTGPRQVGGGPGGEDPLLAESSTTDPTAVSLPPPPQPATTSAFVPPPAPHPQAHVVAGTLDSSSFSAPSYRPPPPPTLPAHAPSGSPVPPIQPSATAYANTQPPNTQSPAPPPPPRPTYPLPPPFLLVAFKEALTEKYLLPLGSLSYISRIGEKEDLAAPKPATPPVAQQPLPEVAPIETLPAPIEASGPIKSRTRASLGRNVKPATPPPPPPPAQEAEPVEDVLPEEKKREPPRSNLPPVGGMQPPDGTVLVSTFVPAGEWRKPDWKELSASLPFNNPLFETRPESQQPAIVKEEEVIAASHDVKASPRSPRLSKASRRPDTKEPEAAATRLPVRGKLLNLATESFLPEDSEVHAVTIRLGEVSDPVWQRIKTISGMVATAEMRSLGECDPQLMSDPDPAAGSSAPPMTGPPLPIQTPAPAPLQRLPFQPSAQLREAYLSRKRNLFRHLLERVPSRKFLRFRLSSPRPDIADATVDKWAPRPYPISTKALYARDEDEDADDAYLLLSPELQPKKGSKKGPEPTVTFEMPVSLDQLDERVAEHAMKGNKAHGLDGRKRHGKRWVPGTICEGCGLSNRRVWRAGPGGKGTLCHPCADKWTSGTLGPLAAPGAASKNKDADEQPSNNDAASEINAEPPVKASDGPAIANADAAITTDPSLSASGHNSTGHAATDDHSRAEVEHVGLNGESSALPDQIPKEESRMDVDPPRSLQIDGNENASEAPQRSSAEDITAINNPVDHGTQGDGDVVMSANTDEGRPA